MKYAQPHAIIMIVAHFPHSIIAPPRVELSNLLCNLIEIQQADFYKKRFVSLQENLEVVILSKLVLEFRASIRFKCI